MRRAVTFPTPRSVLDPTAPTAVAAMARVTAFTPPSSPHPSASVANQRADPSAAGSVTAPSTPTAPPTTIGVAS